MLVLAVEAEQWCLWHGMADALLKKPELGCVSITSTILSKRPSLLLTAENLFPAGSEVIYLDGDAAAHHN